MHNKDLCITNNLDDYIGHLAKLNNQVEFLNDKPLLHVQVMW